MNSSVEGQKRMSSRDLQNPGNSTREQQMRQYLLKQIFRAIVSVLIQNLSIDINRKSTYMNFLLAKYQNNTIYLTGNQTG